jgi:hypothetical protein
MTAAKAAQQEAARVDPIAAPTNAVTTEDIIRAAAERAARNATSALPMFEACIARVEQRKMLDALRPKLNTARQYLRGPAPDSLGGRVNFYGGSFEMLARHLYDLDDKLIEDAKQALARVKAMTAQRLKGEPRVASGDDLALLANNREYSKTAAKALDDYKAASDATETRTPYELPQRNYAARGSDND